MLRREFELLLLYLLDCTEHRRYYCRYHNKRHEPVEATMWLEGKKLKSIAKVVGQTVNVTVTEANAEGGNIPIIPANDVYTVDDPTVGTITVNPDGSAGVKGLKAGICVVTFKDTVYGPSDAGQITYTDDSTPTTADLELS